MSWDIFSKSKIQYFLEKLKGKFVQKETGKGLSTNDFTNEDKALIGQTLGNNTVLTTDKTPFLTRLTLNPTGFSGYVREKLVGASYAWNNILNIATGTSAGITISQASNGLVTLSGTGNGTIELTENNQYISGHKYLTLLKMVSNPNNVEFIIGVGSGSPWITDASTIGSHYVMSVSTYNTRFAIYQASGKNLTGVTFYLSQVDLTLAFGSTIADYLYGLSNNGGITKLRDMGCPIDKYTPYGYGLYSVKTSGKKIVGKNLFDNSTDTMMNTPVGYWAQNDNTVVSFLNTLGVGTYAISFKMKINTVRAELGHTYGIIVRGSNMRDVTMRQDVANPSAGQILSFSGILTITANNKGSINYAWMYTGRDNGGTTDLCTFYEFQIEEGSSATTYAPYAPVTYSLGNDELRGKFDLVNGEIVASGDVKESNGEITRNYGIVDLGTLNWYYSSSRFSATIITMKSVSSWNAIGFVQPKYSVDSVGPSSTGNKIIGIYGDSVFVKDSAYTDATTFKTAMDGVYLVYELATPTTEQSTPFADPMSLVGATTEEYIDTRDIPCPVGAERQYMGQSEDVVEVPSSPQSDGKRVLISEVSGGKEQVYWDIPKLYYKEYTVQGDGTKTYGDLLAELKPYYEALSEDEKTYSKVMMRATSSGNECLTFVGNYWYSRMGVNASGLWLDQIDFQYNKYFKQVSGGSITDYTNTNAGTNVIALRVLTYARAES